MKQVNPEFSWAVQLTAIEMEPEFVCGGICLAGDCSSQRCRPKDILMVDVSPENGGTCFVGLRKK
jgi:hypothetical protein